MKKITKELMMSRDIRIQIYSEVLKEYVTINGSKEQTYSILRFFLEHWIIESLNVKKAISQIIDNDLLYKKNNYRIAMLEVKTKIIETRWNFNEDENDFLMFLLRTTYTYPGCIGNPVDIFKLKETHRQSLDVLKWQSQAGDDGFCTNYMISQMKGGLSLDILIGCPMGCRYCYRIDDENMENYIRGWNPEVIIEPEEIVRRLLNHPWFTPHISAVGVHMSTTEAFLEQIWPYTIEILQLLDAKGLTNRISIITKYILDDEKIEALGKLCNISLDICVCYSGMPQCVEPSSDRKRTKFLKKLVEAEQKYPNLYAIAYYRPIIEGYNTSKKKIRETVGLLKETGVKVVVLGGLKYTRAHDCYFMEMALPRPKGEYEKGKKFLSKQTVDKILSTFREYYGNEMPAILRRSSCARVVARGSCYPDYNAHWTVPDRNCSLNCPQHAICNKINIPDDNMIRDLLERLGKNELSYCVGKKLIIFGTLTMFEKTFLTQNLFYGVLDINDYLKIAKNNDIADFEESFITNINQFSSSDIKRIIGLYDFKRYKEMLLAVKRSTKVTTEILQEIEWLEIRHKLQHSSEVSYEGIQLSLATVLELLNSYVNKKSNVFECLMEDEGRKLIHFIVDKLLCINKADIFNNFRSDIYYRFGLSYYNRRYGRENTDIQMTGYAMIIKALESKYKILSIKDIINVGIVIPMKNEEKNILNSKEMFGGCDLVRIKIEQIEWLFKGNKNINYEMWFIDDNSFDNSGELVKQILNDFPTSKYKVLNFKKIITSIKIAQNIDNPILMDTKNYDEWAKGAAVCWGMYEMAKLKKDLIIYTDLDLTYPLEQCGNLIYECTKFKVMSVIGSRKAVDSWGYYGKKGPNEISKTYSRAITEVYKLQNIKDVQAGFKCFNGQNIDNIIKQMQDRKLSFDAELIALCQNKGEIHEIGVASYHQYIEGKEGTPRNYDVMLKESVEYSKQHNIVCNLIEAPFTKKILDNGGIYSLTKS